MTVTVQQLVNAVWRRIPEAARVIIALDLPGVVLISTFDEIDVDVEIPVHVIDHVAMRGDVSMDRDQSERRWRRRTPRGNFMWLHSWRLMRDRANAGPIEAHGVPIHPDRDGDYYDIGVLPDQRSPELADISLQMKVSGHVTPQELGNHLVKLVQMLLHSTELWEMLRGAPLDGPRTFWPGAD